MPMTPQKKPRASVEDERDPGDDPDGKSTDAPQRHHLHTTISPETEERLKSLLIKFGNYARIVDKAVELLAVRENMVPGLNKGDIDASAMWHLLSTEQNMVAVGKTTFLSYITDLPRKALVENNAIELIEWFHGFKSITELTTSAVLSAIKKIWMSANYFKDVKIEEVKPGKFRVLFIHDMNDVKYSEFWATYFQVLFAEKLGKVVKVLVRPQIFHLEIQQSGEDGGTVL
jgi:hypothetical protein